MFVIVLLFSFIQAATEFLPISSSGHLVLLHEVVDLEGIDAFRFDVALHVGTFLAVVLYFARDFLGLIRGWWRSIRERRFADNPEGRLAWSLLLATILPAIVGSVALDLITSTLRSPMVVVITLILGAVLLVIADRYGRRTRSLHETSVRDVLVVGASQILAFIPGVSRSGITIIAALSRKLNRTAAVRLSFLLSAPVIFAAAVKQILDLQGEHIPTSEAIGLLVGVVASAVFGVLVIRFFLRFVRRHSFVGFAVYRVVLALLVLLFLL